MSLPTPTPSASRGRATHDSPGALSANRMLCPVAAEPRTRHDLVIAATVVRPADWRRWRRLRLAALTQAPESFAEPLATWTGGGDTETRWRARLTDMPFNVVLTVDGRDAGMVSATSPDARSQVTLVSLWVAPWARGCGIGDVAVQAVLAWAREQSGSDLVLSVRATNAAAIALYRRNGLVDVGTSPTNADKWLMRYRR